MAETKYFTQAQALSASSTPAGKTVNLTLAYRTYGSPTNAARNAVLLPSCFGGKLDTTLGFLYDASATADAAPPVFDPASHFVIVVGLLGGSESSSPSTMAEPGLQGADFPATSYEDNVRLQHALARSLGVEQLRAYVGFSMGGQQAYHMAVLFPDFARHVVCLATSARTSWHNWSFLEGPKAALLASEDFHAGRYASPARKGTEAFGRVYSTWALSQDWFRQQCWRQGGFASLQEYLTAAWGKGGVALWDANDLLCLVQTWQKGNVCTLFPEDRNELAAALGRIKAKTLVMPARTDMYFPPEDSEEEIKHLKNGRLAVIESIYGHIAGGGGGTKEDTKFIQDQIRAWMVE